jgi:hypothetical protein
MKKAILFSVFVMITFIAAAQQGSWYIGGVVGFNSNTDKSGAGSKTTTTNWAFAPEVGTFIKDDIQLGAFLGISGGSLKNDDTDIFEYSSISPTVYGRKFFKITDEFSTFAGAYFNISTGGTTNFSASSTPVKHFGMGFRLGIGAAYALSPRFTAVGQYGLFGIQTTRNTFDGNDAGSESSFDFGVNTVGSGILSQGNGSGAVFNIGIYYTFKQP